jgi:hypothetical protein
MLWTGIPYLGIAGEALQQEASNSSFDQLHLWERIRA